MNTENPTKAVAEAVCTAMERAGVTQLALSEQTGIPRTTLIRRLSGHSSFTVAELGAVAAVLGVAVTDLLGDVAA